MMMRLHHAAISTPDLARAVRFYTEVIGFEEAWSFSWDSGSDEADALTDLQDSAASASMLKLGDSFLEIFEFSSPTPAPGNPQRPVCDHGITHVCLQVQDLHAEYERLKTAGMQFHCAPLTQESGYVIYGRDPDGNVIELLEFTEV